MKKHAKYLVLAVTLGIMALIFFFSSQPGETSYQLSGAVADTVQHSKVSAITPSWFSAQNFNANIRKWAHVYIYCALGVSMAVTVAGSNGIYKISAITAGGSRATFFKVNTVGEENFLSTIVGAMNSL